MDWEWPEFRSTDPDQVKLRDEHAMITAEERAALAALTRQTPWLRPTWLVALLVFAAVVGALVIELAS